MLGIGGGEALREIPVRNASDCVTYIPETGILAKDRPDLTWPQPRATRPLGGRGLWLWAVVVLACLWACFWRSSAADLASALST